MKNSQTIFDELLALLHEKDVLRHVILIGSWCLPIYRTYFNNAPEVPILRTMDIDILVPRKLKLATPIDVPSILKSIGFDEDFSHLTGCSKYVHPDMEVEFMVPEYGKGKMEPYSIKTLNVLAQGLRFMNLVMEHSTTVTYKGIHVRVPEPSAFVLLKFLVSTKRKDPVKRTKDLKTATELGAFLIMRSDQRTKLTSVFSSMHKNWQKILLHVLREQSNPLFNVFTMQ
jgi:hypothetical protein